MEEDQMISIVCRRTTNGEGNFTKIRLESGDDQFNLSMYNQPSTETIPIEEFQQLGVQRLAVLRAVELLKEKYGNEPKKYLEMFKEKMEHLMPFYAGKLLAAAQKKARRDDRISHYILRLAYCQSVEMSDWFVRQETELFKCRFQVESGGVSGFLRANNIIPEEVSEMDKRALLDELSQALTLSPDSVLNNPIYKVNCWDVIDLFPSYRLLLRDGFAFINAADLIALVAPQFKENIAKSLANARRNLGFIQEEDRLIPLMKQIVTNGIGVYKREYGNGNSDEIHPEMIDDLARESFPLCMRNIHFNLRKEHHLRHHARQQYGLFLKGIGLSMEGSLEFFRTEFLNRMDGDKFAKEYAYNIRHIYGKEGSRIDRKPLPCTAIILGTAPSPLDCHGCPYKHWESAMLSERLQTLGLKSDQVTEIQGLCKMNRFDKACTKYFEFVHKIPEMEDLITHPNQYYSLSRKMRGGDGVDQTMTTTIKNEE